MEVLINGVTYVPKFAAPKTEKPSLRSVLVAARKHTGESLQAAADAIGTTKGHLWELEKGESCNPTYELLREIIAHYGIDPSEIFGG